MSPSHSRHSPPALSEDDIVAVFLRIPPDDPARLVRASLACTSWRRILTSPDFCRLYREFHGAPPTLGVVVSYWSEDMDHVSRLIPTTSFGGLSEDLGFAPHRWSAVDSRHGRVLVQAGRDDELSPRYVVCDPITGGRWGVPPVPRIDGLAWAAAVLCAKERCDHLGCRGHPFLVAMVVSGPSGAGTTSACVYSSESGVWSGIVTLNHWDQIDSDGRSVLVGNTLHFPYIHSHSVLQYKLGEQKLSVIDVPDKNWDESLVFISAENGVLVFAGWRGTSLSLWSTEAGASAWTRRMVIDLEKLLPPRAFDNKCDGDDDYAPYVSAFAEGAVFLSTMAGLFTVELNSGRAKKVAEVEMAFNVTPWTSFYTLDHARRLRPLP